jgi:hypothetical protein
MNPDRMNFNESIPKSRISKLVDEAERWAKTLDLKRNPVAHISKALQGVPNGRERDELFGAIRRELNRRNNIARHEQHENDELKREAKKIREELKNEQTLKDAYAHQMRQPRDTWDPNF